MVAFAIVAALGLPSNYGTWYTAHVCRELPQYECAGWIQPDAAHRCDAESPLACVAFTHTSTNYPFVGAFDGAGLVTLTIFGPKGPQKLWERQPP